MKKTFTMTLRKLLMLMAVISLLLSLSACLGSPDPTDPNNIPDETPGTTQTDAQEPTEDAPTDAPTEPDEPEQPSVMATITVDDLNVRSNPSTDSTVLRRLNKNDRVLIIEQRVIGDVTWGRITDGWINMNYAIIDGQDPAPTEPEAPKPSTDPIGTGIITASELNIREGADAKYDSVGKYLKGDKVTILETKNGWGRTDKGWISMKYVEMVKEDNKDSETPEIKDNPDIESDGKTKVLGYGVVDNSSLNVRSGPGTKYDQIGKVSRSERFAYYQKSGSWVRIEEGWVSTGYFYIEGTEGDVATGTITTDLNIRQGPNKEFESVGSYKKGTAVDILHQIGGWGYTEKGWISMNYVDTGDSTGTSATVTGNNVNIRKGPGTSYDTAGQYNKGDKITILETKDGWGRTAKGWVKLDYVEMGKSSVGTGTITASELHIRKGPGKDYESVGTYKEGDKVEILETKDGWGRTDKGWIKMEYVKMK